MKKVVDGKLYDTENASLIHEEKDTHRKLYRTPKGAFFTFYKNGDIVPRTEEQAMEYLGRENVEKYIEIFGSPEEA